MWHYHAESLIFASDSVKGFHHHCKTCFNLFSVIIHGGCATDGLCIVFIFLVFRGVQNTYQCLVLLYNQWATACQFQYLRLTLGLPFCQLSPGIHCLHLLHIHNNLSLCLVLLYVVSFLISIGLPVIGLQ